MATTPASNIQPNWPSVIGTHYCLIFGGLCFESDYATHTHMLLLLAKKSFTLTTSSLPLARPPDRPPVVIYSAAQLVKHGGGAAPSRQGREGAPGGRFNWHANQTANKQPPELRPSKYCVWSTRVQSVWVWKAWIWDCLKLWNSCYEQNICLKWFTIFFGFCLDLKCFNIFTHAVVYNFSINWV